MLGPDKSTLFLYKKVGHKRTGLYNPTTGRSFFYDEIVTGSFIFFQKIPEPVKAVFWNSFESAVSGIIPVHIYQAITF